MNASEERRAEEQEANQHREQCGEHSAVGHVGIGQGGGHERPRHHLRGCRFEQPAHKGGMSG